jgi:hypothetical protein
VNREANMRPYFVWLVSLAALMVIIDPAGVPAAFAGGVWPGGSYYGYGPAGGGCYPGREIYVDLPGPGYYPYGRPEPEPIYEAPAYRVAPSAKIIHLTPRK